MKGNTAFCLAALMALLCLGAMAQDISPAENREVNLDTYADLLREDVSSQKVAILSQLMNLTPEKAAKFWPLYAEYDKELEVIGKGRVALIKDYAANYANLNDAKASELARKALDLGFRRLALKKKYFERVEQALSGKDAAKFLQIENQLLKIVDLQILANLPIVQ
ncbi:MAG: hypothetical protein V3T83_14385 [Acidobacteriota bacterium]